MKKIIKSCQTLNTVQHQLVLDNLAYAENLSIKFAAWGKKRGIELEELQAQSVQGLCEAALRYVPVPGADFKTYARNWCVKFIRLRLLGEECYAGTEVDDVSGQLLDDDNEVDLNEQRARQAEELLDLLDPLERKVIGLVTGYSCDEPMGFKEIGRRLRIPPRRVSQIYQRARDKMLSPDDDAPQVYSVIILPY